MPFPLHRSARRQHALFTLDQARSAGIAERTVRRNLARGVWEEITPFVYRAAPAAASDWQQELHALVLSVNGLAYGRSATALYGLTPSPRTPEVLVTRSSRNRPRPGLHSTRTLPRADATVVAGIPATMPARSICDAAASMNPPAVVRLVDAAVVRGFVTPPGLARRAAELTNAKRPGCSRVLAALATQHPELDRARNDWEALVIRAVNELGLPSPALSHPVMVADQRRLLDLAWPDLRIELEFDGYRPHMVREVFDDDRVRQNALVASGWAVFRVTSKLLEGDPRAALAPLVEAFRTRGHKSGQMRPKL